MSISIILKISHCRTITSAGRFSFVQKFLWKKTGRVKGNELRILVQRFRKNRVFPVDQSSPSAASTVFSCTRSITRSVYSGRKLEEH